MRTSKIRGIHDVTAFLAPKSYRPSTSGSVRLPPTCRVEASESNEDAASPMAVLVYEQGQMIAASELGRDATEIGRSPLCDIRVRDPQVSRRHCALITLDGETTVTDLSSANGTVVAGRRIGSVVVSPGATATIGQVVLKFVRVGSPEWEVHCTQFRQIYTDEATGLLNRRGFRMRTEAWHASADPRSLVGLLMIDIDRFKQVNDTYGHLVGDAVIEHIAGVIRSLAPANGCAARLGGEEFAVFFTECSAEQLGHVAEQLRAGVEHAPAIADGCTVAATISIGGAFQAAGEESLRPMFVDADAALYEAKAGGRNRCVVRGASMVLAARVGSMEPPAAS